VIYTDIRKLETLRIVAGLGSISKAAEKMGYSQPGLTGMLNRLEDEIGFPLLERGSSGVVLTPRGRELMPAIDSVLDAYSDFEKSVQAVRHNGDDVLRIATYTSISRSWLPVVLRRFSEQFPQAKLVIKDGSGGEIEKWVSEGSVDVGLASSNFAGNLEFIHLFDDPYYAVLPGSNDIGDTYDIHSFEGQNFLVPSYGMDLDILRTLQRHGVTPVFSLLAMEDQAVIKMVEQGLGVSMLSELVLKGCTSNLSLAPIEPASWRELGIVVKPARQTGRLLKGFISCLLEGVPSN
jgi:DNA-binding transcriptional LysR family regulator